LSFDFSVGEVVAMGLIWPGEARAEFWLQRALAAFDLVALAERPYPTLSGGEQQRVQLARVWLQRTQGAEAGDASVTPGWVLLDEPLSHLDMRHQHQCLQVFADLAKHTHSGVVMVLHDLQMAAQYADRLLLLQQGEVKAQGTPSEVLQPDLLEAVYQCPLQVLSHPGGWPLVVAKAD
jgi:iron complex transport system ATP-binding protein